MCARPSSKLHLGLDIDDADAATFVSKMTPMLAAASSPLEVATPWSLLEWKAGRLTTYEAALRAKFPELQLSETERTRAASTVLDSLCAARAASAERRA